MKMIVLFASVSVASAAIVTSGAAASHEQGCVEHAKKFLTKPAGKDWAIEQALDYCALDKKVEDKNFVCPHFVEVLNSAFSRVSPSKMLDAESFCSVSEYYVAQLQDAHKIPGMGKGAGLDFEVHKKCEPTALGSFGQGKKTLSPANVGDFWYALCMNQDCAHFLPSRTRWCSDNHQPTHSAQVCEAMRSYAMDDGSVLVDELVDGGLTPKQVCHIYDDFVKDTHLNVQAYMHVVHATKDHPVPSPEDKDRALKSAQMKNAAGGHKLRDSAGNPVKSAAATSTKLFMALLSVAGLHHM